MRNRRYAPCNLGRNTINLGKQGEANHLRIEFDCSAWLAEYPDAVIRLYYFAPERAQDDPRRPVLGEEGTDRVWIVSEGDTKNAGNGVIELVLEDAFTGARIKSATGYTTVTYSPSAVPMSDEDNDSGGNGEDGGYYRPSVSSSGDLSWTPSKAGMPSVDTVNIKGPKGNDGATGATGPQGSSGPAGADGQAATFEIVDADSIPYGSKPTVTEEAGSTPQNRKYRLGIPEGKPGTNGNGGSVELDTTLTQYGQAADAGAVGNALTQEKQAREQAVTQLNEANTKQDEEIAKKVNDAVLAKVAKSGKYEDLSGKPEIPTVPDSLKNPNALTFTGAVNETYDGSAPKSIAIPAGGTTDYSELENKPSINGVELTGEKSLEDLGIGEPTDEQVSSSVQEWLDEHPEATTTVADGSITPPKLSFYTAKRSVKSFATELDTSKFEAISGGNDTSQAGQLGLWYKANLSEHIPVAGAINILKRNAWFTFSKFCDLNIVFYDADGNHVKTALTENEDYYRLGSYAPSKNQYLEMFSIPIPEGAATYRWYIKHDASLDDLANIEFLDFEALIDYRPWKSDEVSDMLEQNDAVTGNVFWNYKVDVENSLELGSNTLDVSPFSFIPENFADVTMDRGGTGSGNVRMFFQPIQMNGLTEIYVAIDTRLGNDAGFGLYGKSGFFAYDENWTPLTAKSLLYEVPENDYVKTERLEQRYDGTSVNLYKVTVDPSVAYLLPVVSNNVAYFNYLDAGFIRVSETRFNPKLRNEEVATFEAPLAVKNYINDVMRNDYYRFKQIGRLVPNGNCNYVAWNHNTLHYDATRNLYVMTMRGSNVHGGNVNAVKFVKIDPVTMESVTSDIVVGGVTADWVNGFTLDDGDNYLLVCRLSGVMHYVTSTNGGSTWTDGGAVVVDTSGAVNNIDTSKYDYTKFFNLHRLNTGTLLASYDDTVSPTNEAYPHIARSTDGVNWTLLELPVGQSACEMAFYEHDGTIMMIGRRNSYGYNITDALNGESYNNAVISYSYDDGLTWTASTGSATVRANVQNVSVREHDGVVELMAMNRDFNKYSRGYIYHYTATPEEAISDRFTLREIFQCNAYGAGDVTGGGLAFDKYGRALYTYSDNHGVSSNYNYQHFMYGSKAEAPTVCADGVASEFLPYSGQKVQSLIDALEARIKALEG